ncbi:patatin-like phospholipase family protein [Polycyclovorans algicola]|uniref:patatin-like phospholipase family protein n=1 Tax=Polycyclovorans algicola TaxID=616992 RepID=UPI000694CAAE|nr:patatin-like phospholipase family protein [Polycyclovorans algicola]
MNLADSLRTSALFESVSDSVFEALVARGTWVVVRGGDRFLSAGDPSDRMYILATGRLAATSKEGEMLGEIAPGEPIGEIGLLADELRLSNVTALRDSILICFDRDAMLEVLRAEPDALLVLTRTIIRRLRRTQKEKRRARALGRRAVALIPLVPGLDLRAIAHRLVEALSRHGSVLLIDPETVDRALGPGAHERVFEHSEEHQRIVTWLAEQEQAHRYLVYLCPPRTGAWARRCMRQADRLLLGVDAGEKASVTPMLTELLGAGVQAPRDILMLADAPGGNADVMGWREQARADGHVYAAPDGRVPDAQRIARLLTRRSIGLVLGGGGARGFAHIGLFRALEELEIPIDVVGGSSMGAYFAGLKAMGHDTQTMRQIAREMFVEHNFLNDYIFPSVAFIRGRKFFNELHRCFGDVQIEHLPTRYFCVSSNLSRGRLEVHDRGPLYLWTATSMAVPGVAPPVVWNEDLLVDGALLNSLPTDVMEALDLGPIIASDVSTGGELTAPGIVGPDPEGLFNWRGDAKRPSLLNIMFRTATVGGQRGARERAGRADVYLRMPVSSVGMFDWKQFDEVNQRGYEYALEQLTPVRDQLVDGMI